MQMNKYSVYFIDSKGSLKKIITVLATNYTQYCTGQLSFFEVVRTPSTFWHKETNETNTVALISVPDSQKMVVIEDCHKGE